MNLPAERPTGSARPLAFSLRVLLIPFWFLVAAVDPAAARGFSALAVDAHTGAILFAQAPDSQRHPASLTKVMTLYILFQEIAAGRLNLSTKLKVSKHAAARPPSKLGLKEGDTIPVEDAIKALITRSANDVAAVVGENISGSEFAFAARMTNTARSLGMTRTTFRNASGLPNPAQVTTARDMATLGLRVQRDFPSYYHYFSIRSFTYKGQVVRTHNRLLGRFKGTDGIKTGYIRASGFNLTTSAARGDKRVIGVVMGATSSSARNQYMMKMLEKHFAKAKVSKKNVIAALAGKPPGIEPGALVEFAEATPLVSEAQPAKAGAIAMTAPATDTVGGQPAPAKTGPPSESSGLTSVGDGFESESSNAGEDDGVEWPKPASASKENNSVEMASTAPMAATASFQPAPTSEPPEVAAVLPNQQVEQGKTTWDIQVGAYPKAKDARRRLDEVRALKLAALRQKAAQAVPVSKGKSMLYRARFLGFSEKSAKEACRELGKRGVSCLTLAPQG